MKLGRIKEQFYDESKILVNKLNELIKGMTILEKQMITIQENQVEQEDYLKKILEK